MSEIQDKNKCSVEAAPTTCSAGKLIRAKEFLDCFRQNPDDLHLMRKFSLSRKQLEKVYAALIEKGWLAEFEYNHRGIAAGISEGSIGQPTPQPGSEIVRQGYGSESGQMEKPGGQIDEAFEHRSNCSTKINSLSRAQTSSCPKRRTILFQRSNKPAFQRPVYCPKCRLVTDPCSPDSCVSCGVVYSKFQSTIKGQGISLWEVDYRYK